MGNIKPETNICGLVVHVSPGASRQVSAVISGLPGVDIHADGGDDRLIVTVLDTDQNMAIDQITAINRLSGVVSTTLAYHLIEDPDPLSGNWPK
jgi:nitrate reductase NapD